jgi:hypothetical protein
MTGFAEPTGNENWLATQPEWKQQLLKQQLLTFRYNRNILRAFSLRLNSHESLLLARSLKSSHQTVNSYLLFNVRVQQQDVACSNNVRLSL